LKRNLKYNNNLLILEQDLDMSKKKGLGRDINKSLEIMDATVSSLKGFTNMPLKKGIRSNGTKDEALLKNINSALEKAVSLMNDIDIIYNQVNAIKMDNNSRFAFKVVSRFIEDEGTTF